jgi:hypothetical protein
MKQYSGSYRLACAENKAALFKAWFNNAASDKDIELMMHPDNQVTINYCFSDNSVKGSMDISMKPEYNFDFDAKFGVENVFTKPFECKTMLSVKGNVINDVTTYKDGSVLTSVMTFTSQGLSCIVSGAAGYIGNMFYERCDADLCGFWMLESHDNMDKVMMEDGNLSASVAADMLDGIALRITESNGWYTMTDYVGGGSKTIRFKMGEEFEIDDPALGLKGSEVVTMAGPGKMMMVYKDKSGKNSAWEGTVTDDHMIFKVTKPLNTQTGTITYKRLPDVVGSWKTIAMDNAEAIMKASGMTDEQAAQMLEEKPTMVNEYVGKGRYKYSSNSAIFPDPIFWRSGEEFTFNIGGHSITEIRNFTKTGEVCCIKMGGKNMIVKTKVGKNFCSMEETIEGEPGVKATFILARV